MNQDTVRVSQFPFGFSHLVHMEKIMEMGIGNIGLNSLSGFRISSTRMAYVNIQAGDILSQFPFGFSHLVHTRRGVYEDWWKTCVSIPFRVFASRPHNQRIHHYRQGINKRLNSLSGFRISSTWIKITSRTQSSLSSQFPFGFSHLVHAMEFKIITVRLDKSQFPFGFSHLVHARSRRRVVNLFFSLNSLSGFRISSTGCISLRSYSGDPSLNSLSGFRISSTQAWLLVT